MKFSNLADQSLKVKYENWIWRKKLVSWTKLVGKLFGSKLVNHGSGKTRRFMLRPGYDSLILLMTDDACLIVLFDSIPVEFS